jgi:short-chain fatty acids transporter
VLNAKGMTLSDTIAHWFVGASPNSTAISFLAGLYSAVLSAGGERVIEVPYITKAFSDFENRAAL